MRLKPNFHRFNTKNDNDHYAESSLSSNFNNTKGMKYVHSVPLNRISEKQLKENPFLENSFPFLEFFKKSNLILFNSL